DVVRRPVAALTTAPAVDGVGSDVRLEIGQQRGPPRVVGGGAVDQDEGTSLTTGPVGDLGGVPRRHTAARCGGRGHGSHSVRESPGAGSTQPSLDGRRPRIGSPTYPSTNWPRSGEQVVLHREQRRRSSAGHADL